MLGLIHATTQVLGIALLNNVMVQLNEKALAHVLPKYFLPTDGFYAIYSHQKSLSTAAHTSLDYIIDKTGNCCLEFHHRDFEGKIAATVSLMGEPSKCIHRA
ncbi:hypothetical protein J3D54_005180 [Pseudomonas sp. GGS8]|uniref:hypothetical protein n=1 Tax=Pseudomonas sp. GGS8 TaxID=2817892 RepID=UPI00209F3E51|nr:hypothetical protein [Pseudomonas sp. GGS8]MCP1446048.1 hypothetical protein [Pseudomonas sp. GGS8]